MKSRVREEKCLLIKENKHIIYSTILTFVLFSKLENYRKID